jgi:hypothetical protein
VLRATFYQIGDLQATRVRCSVSMVRNARARLRDLMQAQPGDRAHRAQPATELSDEDLEAAIATSRGSVGEAEQALNEARERLEQQRRQLRVLEAEAQRRRTGLEAAPKPQQSRRKRSVTVADALSGRGGLDLAAPFTAFRFFSLQRQEIVLQPAGDRLQQAVRWYDPAGHAEHWARTLGEARRLQERGCVPGRERDPLQRVDVWYIDDAKPGRLRLDQIFVEQDGGTA